MIYYIVLYCIVFYCIVCIVLYYIIYYIMLYYNLMRPPSDMPSVVDRNVVMRRISVFPSFLLI